MSLSRRGHKTDSLIGTWNLHELLPRDMDFFIVLSSLAGIIGSVSQGNYAAGNTFQDALIHYRRAKGLAGTSLDLGIMKSIGYVEENEDIGAKLSQFKLVSSVRLSLQFENLLTYGRRRVWKKINLCIFCGVPWQEQPTAPNQYLHRSWSELVTEASSRLRERLTQTLTSTGCEHWRHSLIFAKWASRLWTAQALMGGGAKIT